MFHTSFILETVKEVRYNIVYMKTEVIQVDQLHINQEAIAKAGRILRAGGLVAFPTETVYGLGANALNEEAAAKIYAAKGRPSDNPLIVHIASAESLPVIAGQIDERARRLSEKFWPGPLTMIFQKTDAVPMGTTGGLGTVAVRMPANNIALGVIRAGGGFVAAPSANTSGRPSPTLASHVYEDLAGKVPLILDGGPVKIGLESTIVDLSVPVATVLRPGAISLPMLRETIGEVQMDAGLGSESGEVRPKAPGMKYRHYAPRAELMIVSGNQRAVTREIHRLCTEAHEQGKRVGVIAAEESCGDYDADCVRAVGCRADDAAVAAHLYDVLRGFDHEQVDVIYSESFADGQFGQAIMNRLLKAAGHRVIGTEEG